MILLIIQLKSKCCSMMTQNSLLSILRHIVVIALPLSAGRLLNILSNFISMMMVAQCGKNELAAGFLAFSSTIAVVTSVVTVFYALSIRIRYYRGQNNNQVTIGILVKNGFFIAMILAIPAALIISNMDKMLLFIGQEPSLIYLTKKYFYYAGIGIFPFLALSIISQFYVGIGKPHMALIIELVSFPLTILLSYTLILGHFGFPKLGLTGVSLATLWVQTIILLASLIMVQMSKTNHVYGLFKKPFIPSWPVCRAMLVLGLPIGIQFGGELAAIAVSTYFMGYFGVDALAALQITSQYSIIVIMLSVGLAQALSLLVSEEYGKPKTSNLLIKKHLQASMLLLMLYIIPVTILFCTQSTRFAEFYMGTKNLRPDFISLIQVFFILSALFLFFDGIRYLLSGTLRGLHNSQTATRINLATLWFISVPVSWMIVFIFDGGPIALRIGFLSGFIIAVLALALYLYNNLKDLKPVIRS